MSRNNIFSITICIILFIVLEFAAFIAGKYFSPIEIIFDPHYSAAEKILLQQRYDNYLERRDPVLGWPPVDQRGRDEYDTAGSRIIPNFPDPDASGSCVSLYGDSFTWSSEVEKEDAWGNILSGLLQCRVSNFGVGGYGSDQAYLRYLQNSDDDAQIIFMNHLSENIMRNLAQFRSLLYGYRPQGRLSFKPRFILDAEGALQLVDIPDFERQAYADVLVNPENYLPHEYFLPDGKSGLVRFQFPYSWSLARTLGHFHVRATLAGRPWYAEFYEPGHPGKGLELTTEILLAFEKSAQDRGQVPVVTVIPTGLDLVYFKEHGVWVYQNLLDNLREKGVQVLNFGEGIMTRLGDEDPCALFDNCSSHFNERGYRYLGEIAHDEIKARGILPTASAN